MTDETNILICNKIQTPDGTILESISRHDYKTYTDTISGEVYMVDGGMSYLRRNKNTVPYIELSVYLSDSHEMIRDNFKWGTYGKNGDQPLTRKFLKDMSNVHILAILTNETCITSTKAIFEHEIEYRKMNNIEVEDDD